MANISILMMERGQNAMKKLKYCPLPPRKGSFNTVQLVTVKGQLHLDSCLHMLKFLTKTQITGTHSI